MSFKRRTLVATAIKNQEDPKPPPDSVQINRHELENNENLGLTTNLSEEHTNNNEKADEPSNVVESDMDLNKIITNYFSNRNFTTNLYEEHNYYSNEKADEPSNVVESELDLNEILESNISNLVEMGSKSPLKCIHCDKIYKERKRLTEHIKRSHKKNLAGESILTSKFTCATCSKVFGRKDHLIDHIKNFHNSSEEFKCNYCTYKAKFKWDLKKHILKCDVNPKKFSCSYCETGFNYKSSLQRHEKIVHGIQRRLRRKQINRKCPLCSFTSDSKRQNEINTHFSKVHELALEPEEHRFDNMDDFYKWKDDLEKRTYTFYAKQEQNANRGYYICHRRGKFKRTGTSRRLKLDGSCKINGHCPSDIKLKISKFGTVSVFYVPTHVGHTNQLKFCKLSKKEKQMFSKLSKKEKQMFSKLSKKEKQIIACQLLQKTPHEEEIPLIIEEEDQPILTEDIVSEINNDNNININNKLQECLNLIPLKANTANKKQFAIKKINALLAALDAMDATEDLSAKKSISRVIPLEEYSSPTQVYLYLEDYRPTEKENSD